MKSLDDALLVSVILLAFAPFTTFAQGGNQDEATKKIEEAEGRFHEAKQVIQGRYRKELADALAKAERVEIFLLDFDALEPTPSDFLFWETRLEEGEFPIMPYGEKTKVLKKATLTPEQRAEFLPALQKVVGGESGAGGAMCHMPIHGVRIFSGDEIVFQTSICWHCGNYYLHYPDGAHWEGLADSNDLAKALEKMMPIPQAEMDRFNAKYGPDRNQDDGKAKDEKKSK